MKTIKQCLMTLFFCLGLHSSILAFTIGGLDYTVRSDYQVAVSHSYDTIKGHLVIPQTVTYEGIDYTVTSIEPNAFTYRVGLTGITIPESMTTISDHAFYGCDSLKTLLFNAMECNKASINAGYFGWTKLTSVSIGPKVTHLPAGFLLGCTELTDVAIPESVTSIGSWAFGNCRGLTSLTIPEKVAIIEGGAFSGCDSLKTLTFNAIECNKTSTDYFDLDPGWNQLTTVSIGPKVTCIPSYLLNSCSSLTHVSIPESVTEIGSSAFSGCQGLTNLTLPENLITIGSAAFSDCTGLTSITIPEKVTGIGHGAFRGCTKLITLNYQAIDCQLVTSYLSSWEQLSAVNFGSKVKVLPANLLAGCTGLTHVTIPESVTTIGDGAFQNCSGLTSITLSQNVVYVGNEAFMACTGLQRFTWNALPEAVSGNRVIESDYNLEQLTGPASLLQMYEGLNYTSLSKLESIHITGGFLTDTCFSVLKASNRTLKTIDLSKASNTTLDDEALLNFYKLESITLPTSLVTIGYKALAECAALKSLSFPQTVERLDDRAFENCYNLTTIDWGENGALKSIGARSFFNCQSLQMLDIPEGVTDIGLAAFQGCGYVETITLPATLCMISDRCFAGNSRVKQLTVRANVPPSISTYTFDEVDRSIPVYIPFDALGAYQADALWSTFQLIPTSLEQVEEATYELTVDGRTLIVNGIERPHISVYDINGRLVGDASKNKLDVPASGLYLVRINNSTQKVLVK